jgi:hypothetical protein
VKEAKQEPSNHEPLALDQAVELDEDTTAAITLAGSDQDGDPLTFRIVSAPAHGTLSGDVPALKYTPSPDYNGSDMLIYVVNDGRVDSKPATVNITIDPANDPPRAVAASIGQAHVGDEVPLDGSLSSDVDGDQLTYMWTLISSPPGLAPAFSHTAGPSASLVPYLPGQYKAQLVVNDGTTDSAADTVTVSVAYVPFSLTAEKLYAGDGAAGDRFGSSVSIDNQRAIIGAEGKEVAYIYESGSPWTEKAQIVSGKPGDGFGSAVAVSGDYALVGSPVDDDLGTDSGAAYIFKQEGARWTQAAKLLSGDGKAGDFFGAAVALSGDCAVVGAYGVDTNEAKWLPRFGDNKYVPGPNAPIGMAWNSDRHVWENKSGQFKLQPNPAEGWAYNFRPLAIRLTHNAPQPIALLSVTGAYNGSLGTARIYSSRHEVSLSGVTDIGLIYAYYPPAINNIEFLVPPTGGGRDAGSAYVFKREGTFWTQQAYLTAKDGAEGDAFGISVAISDQTIIVGADGDDDNGHDSGSAYIFAQGGSDWVEEAKLLAEDGQAGGQFGASVAISGGVAVIGAPGADSAYVFSYNGQKWVQEAKLTGDRKGDRFGASVSTSGDYIVIGAPGADGSGAIYVFKFNGSEWNLEGKRVPTDKGDGQGFGGSVSISGDVILSGAMGDSEKADQAGAAYAYSIDTYHTAGIWAEPEVIKKEGSSTLSWSWVNALVVEIAPDIGTFTVDNTPTGSGSAAVSPEATTTYTITAYGAYGVDKASVTMVVEP